MRSKNDFPLVNSMVTRVTRIAKNFSSALLSRRPRSTVPDYGRQTMDHGTPYTVLSIMLDVCTIPEDMIGS
ncbi:hypothetical protein RRG08_003689 [Elysia crispata]|uniref:Uncharacterized protein n=1 Tax=Elysia crispata TaxID=231223 RepID=A0AAE1AVN1_9GAST|nr:hypothetical protein RRG08_003689 [Elysia crispata]